jgi:hypothetical protein
VPMTIFFISLEDMMTSIFMREICADSKSICRQTPHGEITSVVGALAPLPITAMRPKTVCPMAAARTIAERSAQIVAE